MLNLSKKAFINLKLILLILIFISLFLLLLFLNFKSKDKQIDNKNISSTFSDSSQIKKDKYFYFEQSVLKSKLIKDLPKDSIIIINFYNFDNDSRIVERSYILRKNSLSIGERDNPSLKIFISSKYIQDFKDKDFCYIVKAANSNGDFEVITEKSKSALLWEFKNMLKYKDCFGL